MKMRKIAAIALAFVMLAGLFTGCSIGSKTVMNVNGKSISEQVFLGAIGQVNQIYLQSYGMGISEMLSQDFGDGVTGESIAKEIASNYIKEFEAIRALAKENNIKLTREDKSELKAAEKEAIESQGGRNEYLKRLKEEFITEEFAVYLNETMAIYNKVYSELFVGDGKYAVSLDAMKEQLADGYIRVKHVLIQANDPSAEDYAEKRKQAEDIAARAKAGEDFDALIKEFGEDPGMESSPNGYIFDKDGYDLSKSSQMITEFAEASHALSENGVSDVVTTPYGFHIIKRFPLDDQYIEENSEAMSVNFAPQSMADVVTERIEQAETTYTKAYDGIDLYAYFGVERPDAPLAPEEDFAGDTSSSEDAADASHEGHDHE